MHQDHVPALPEGFESVGSTPVCPVQGMVRLSSSEGAFDPACISIITFQGALFPSSARSFLTLAFRPPRILDRYRGEGHRRAGEGRRVLCRGCEGQQGVCEGERRGGANRAGLLEDDGGVDGGCRAKVVNAAGSTYAGKLVKTTVRSPRRVLGLGSFRSMAGSSGGFVSE